MSDNTLSPFEQNIRAMGLSPQEQNLYIHHLANLYGPGKVEHPNGSISTLSQAVVSGPGSLYYNIPTVWDGKQLPVDEARQRASQAGWDNWPAYATPEQADLRYEAMHDFLEKDTGAFIATHR